MLPPASLVRVVGRAAQAVAQTQNRHFVAVVTAQRQATMVLTRAVKIQYGKQPKAFPSASLRNPNPASPTLTCSSEADMYIGRWHLE